MTALDDRPRSDDVAGISLIVSTASILLLIADEASPVINWFTAPLIPAGFATLAIFMAAVASTVVCWIKFYSHLWAENWRVNFPQRFIWTGIVLGVPFGTVLFYFAVYRRRLESPWSESEGWESQRMVLSAEDDFRVRVCLAVISVTLIPIHIVVFGVQLLGEIGVIEVSLALPRITSPLAVAAFVGPALLILGCTAMCWLKFYPHWWHKERQSFLLEGLWWGFVLLLIPYGLLLYYFVHSERQT